MFGSEGIDVIILGFDNRWSEWSASFPGHFTPEKRLRSSLKWRLSGYQKNSGRLAQEGNILLHPRIEPRFLIFVVTVPSTVTRRLTDTGKVNSLAIKSKKSVAANYWF
jgi:hypothetical protein